MEKTMRAVVVYRSKDKQTSQVEMKRLTTLIYGKNLQKLKEHLAAVESDSKEIKLVSVEWKNWWGAKSEK
jgi:hypothetical protein